MRSLDRLKEAYRHDMSVTLSRVDVRQLIEEFDRLEDLNDPPDFVERGIQQDAI